MVDDVLRTPEDRFTDLPGWEHDPRYVEAEVDGLPLRLARVDEGGGDPVVLLHGEPTWGFLYRRVVGPLLDAGLRVVVPDHPGFGRSDKPTDRGWFSYESMYASLESHLERIGLDDPVTLVVHDWGGPLGLRWAVEHPGEVARLAILDTALYAPGGEPTDDWLSFRDFVAGADELPVGMLVAGGSATDLPDEVVAGYEAPFHTPAAHAGAIELPLMVPLSDDDPGARRMWEVNQALDDWHRDTLIVWGDDDHILPPSIGRRWADQIPGCVGFETLENASHFLQEDRGPALGERLAEFAATGR